MILPITFDTTLEEVVTKCLKRLGRSQEHMLMPSRGLHAVVRAQAAKIDYLELKDLPIRAIPRVSRACILPMAQDAAIAVAPASAASEVVEIDDGTETEGMCDVPCDALVVFHDM